MFDSGKKFESHCTFSLECGLSRRMHLDCKCSEVCICLDGSVVTGW